MSCEKMKLEEHLKAHREFVVSIQRLRGDMFGNRRLIVEACVLAAANLTNSILHAAGKRPEAYSDVKHNDLFGHLTREKPVKEYEELARCHNRLEHLKYSITHGITRDGERAREAVDTMECVERIAKEYVEVG